jgi:uncharacterized membrane protein
MLVAIPIGLWVFAVVADLVRLAGWGGPLWTEVARYCVGGGIVGALLAAVPGLVDLTSISDRRVRTIALTHMTVNLIAVGLFAVSLWLRGGDPLSGPAAAASGAGLLVVLVGGWLGGELVERLGVGVDNFQDLNAPSSLRARAHTSSNPA